MQTLLLLLLACAVCTHAATATQYNAAFSPSAFAGCTASQAQSVALVCGGVSLGRVLVRGVVAYSCLQAPNGVGTLEPCLSGGADGGTVYQLGIDAVMDASASTSCTVVLPWSSIPLLAPGAASAVLCNTLTKCASTDPTCAAIFTQTVTVTVSVPTWARSLVPTYTFPYDYVRLSRRKIAMAVAAAGYPSTVPATDALRIDQARAFLGNDDADDQIQAQCLNNTLFPQGIRTRGGYSQPRVTDASQRTFPCTQDYNQCKCQGDGNGCSQSVGSGVVTNGQGCAIYYCGAGSNGKTYTYLASTSTCWKASNVDAPVTGYALGEYSSRINVPDTSVSCCNNCKQGPCGGTCNRADDQVRYIYPKKTPSELMGQYINSSGDSTNIASIAMSNTISTNPAINQKLLLNTTKMPSGGFSGISSQRNGNTADTNDYRYYLQLVDNSDVLPSSRRGGTYQTLDMGSRVTSLVCAQCGSDTAFWSGVCSRKWPAKNQPCNHPDSSFCTRCGSNVQEPGVTAFKSYVLGISPTGTLYQTNAQGTTQVRIYVDVQISIATTFPDQLSATRVVASANMREGVYIDAPTGSKTVLMVVAGASNPPDPYAKTTLAGTTTNTSVGMIVVHEPAADVAFARFSAFNTTNPWSKLRNPLISGQPLGCAECLPDQLTALANSSGAAAWTLWYAVTSDINDNFLPPGMSNTNIYACNDIGYSDRIFQEDDCDQPQIDTSFISITSPLLSRIENFGPVQGCANGECPCGGVNNPRSFGGRAQSYGCIVREGKSDMCRPNMPSAALVHNFQDFRTALAISGNGVVSTSQRAAVNQMLPLDWNASRPNYWLGKDLSAQKSLALYYQVGPKARAASAYEVTGTANLLVSSAVVVAIPPPPLPYLAVTYYCGCVDPNNANPVQTLSGSLVISFTTSSSAYINTGFEYTLSLTYSDGSATCRFGSSATARVVAKQNFINSPTVAFTCTTTSAFKRTSSLQLGIAPYSTQPGYSPSQTPTVQYLQPCSCTSKLPYNPSGPCFLKSIMVSGTADFSFALTCPEKCPLTGCEIQNPTATPPVIVVTEPNGTTTVTQPPIPGNDNVPVPRPAPQPGTSVPQNSTPNVPGAPGANATNATKPTPVPQADDGSSTTLYIMIGVGVGGAVLLAIALILIVVCCCKSKEEEEEEARKEKIE